MRLVVHNDGAQLRGSERQLLHLATGLRALGHDVLVSCRAQGALERELAAASVPVTPVRPSGDLAVGSALAFRRLLTTHRPDALLLTSWKRVFVGSYMASLARVPRVIVRLGIVRRLPPPGFSAWKLVRAFGRYVDALIVNSAAVRDAWLGSAPWFPEGRVHVVHNGVARVVGDAARIRRELGVPDEIRLVTAVAALEPRKGIDLLLRALAALPPHVHGVIAGEGAEGERLKRLSASLGLDGRVHWLGARADVPDVLAASAAFVLPSRQDSIANALLEAMAAGVPVVTTQGNGAEEALAPVPGRGPAGWIVPTEDPAALAAAIGRALDGDGERVLEASRRVQRWFGVERMVRRYEELLFG